MPRPSRLRTQLQEDGFVVICQLLSPAQVRPLHEAASRTTSLARSGNWEHIRTVGKQFPPWPSRPDPTENDGGIWGAQGLLNPALPDAATFTRNYFSDAVLSVVKELLGCGDDDLVMELYNLLMRPDRDWGLTWHRDDIPASATADEEMRRLQEPEWHTQWNLALCDDDDSLIVVPGSHKRARTEIERSADPYQDPLPGQVVVKLHAGDVVFYNNNILHRGVYKCTRDRMSLHGSVGHRGSGRLRARNVLQHGVGEWVDRCDLSVLEKGRLRDRANGMRDRLVKLGKESGEVGYSLQG